MDLEEETKEIVMVLATKSASRIVNNSTADRKIAIRFLLTISRHFMDDLEAFQYLASQKHVPDELFDQREAIEMVEQYLAQRVEALPETFEQLLDEYIDYVWARVIGPH